VFVRSKSLDVVISLLFVLAMGACGNFGSCGACSAVSPLPGGKLPADQTVEGGAQIRVTPSGFNKLTSVLPSLVNQALANGFCVPQGQVGSLGTLGTGARWCDRNVGQCTPGCDVDVNLNSLVPTVTSNQQLNIRLSLSIATTVHITGKVVGIGFDCNLGISSNNLNGDFDIAFAINPTTGELDIHLQRINSFQLGLDFSGCGPLSSVGDFLSAFLDSFIGQFIIQLLTPTIDDLLQSFIPRPLGIAGMMDVGKLLAAVSPGTDALMEARIVPGGYVTLNGGGMSLGVITGLNADEDPATRGPGLASEPNLCVPPIPPPNFGAPPASLPITSRSTYALGVANEFNGAPEPASDIAMGVSETTLDLAGHHAVTSGAMCLGVGTSFINQLNVGTISLLVPSLSELQSDQGNDPLLMVTRPQRALDFTIGDNTPASPAITIGISHMEVDFYAFLYERYVRAFTMDLTMNVGVNLEFEQPPGMPAVIKPSLVGISSSAVEISVLNSQFVKETPDMLEAVLPTVFDLVTPLLGQLPDVQVPEFAGFALQNLSIKHVKTTQDDFLALFASLAPGAALKALAKQDHLAATAVAQLEQGTLSQGARSTAIAQLARVATPEPAKVRAALAKAAGGEMPKVEFTVPRFDAQGRELEWTYNLNGGLYHPYTAPATAQLTVADRAFAWQGKYTIGLKSRVKGDYHTVSEEQRFPVIIDSAPPTVFADKAAWDGDAVVIPIFDIVSERNVQYAFGKPDSDAPQSAWFDGSVRATRADLAPYVVDNQLAVYAKDEAGNTTVALINPFHGQPGEGGCACETSRSPTTGGLVLVLLVGGVLFVRRKRRLVKKLGLWAAMSIVMSVVPGCSCGKPSGACETVADCDGFCDQGLPFCLDNQCVCNDDIPVGHLGPYSDVAVGGGAIWVSAYHQSYGDLVVANAQAGRIPDTAWEWVDGVPDGPVVVPDSLIRHGIAESGPDVGMYTSIGVAPDGTPVVTYFDRDTGSLKFAARVGGTWQNHVVDAGTGSLGELGALVGMYSSLTLRSDDGRPGVAYLAHVADANGARAEVRFAAAQTPFPTSPGDWMMWVVDTAPLPPDDPNNPNIYPLPTGLGLFVDATRLPNQAPVVSYYDRSNGQLKIAKFDPSIGQFATPIVLDGASVNVDAGWSPSVAVDPQGVVHVAYVNASHDNLQYITDAASTQAEVVDDGYRVVGVTVDGLPKPEFHFVGDDAGLVLANGGTLPMIAYQDSTTEQLELAVKQQNGTWKRTDIAGATDPWPGAYGFFAAAAVTATDIVMSTWVIDQPTGENWVEVFTRPTTIQ